MEVGLHLPPGDPRLIEKIVQQLKSQGIFDQFRKDLLSDVDTKPAYQNLRQRVEGTVAGYLADQPWRPDLNKNQLRDSLRKHIHESGFLELGVERIVDQVVNPKIYTVFLPKVEDVVYGFLGLEKPSEKNEVAKPEPVPVEKKKDSIDFLPMDLDPISPSPEKFSDSELKDDNEDEEESPPYERIEVDSPDGTKDTASRDSLMKQESKDEEATQDSVIKQECKAEDVTFDSLMKQESKDEETTRDSLPKQESKDEEISRDSMSSGSSKSKKVGSPKSGKDKKRDEKHRHGHDRKRDKHRSRSEDKSRKEKDRKEADKKKSKHPDDHRSEREKKSDDRKSDRDGHHDKGTDAKSRSSKSTSSSSSHGKDKSKSSHKSGKSKESSEQDADKPDTKVDKKPDAASDCKSDIKPDIKAENKQCDAKPVDSKSTPKPESKPDCKLDGKCGTKPETKPNAKLDSKPDAVQGSKSDPKSGDKHEGDDHVVKKKPKIAANIYEVRKIMKMRKDMERMEKERESKQDGNEPKVLPPDADKSKLAKLESGVRKDVDSTLKDSKLMKVGRKKHRREKPVLYFEPVEKRHLLIDFVAQLTADPDKVDTLSVCSVSTADLSEFEGVEDLAIETEPEESTLIRPESAEVKLADTHETSDSETNNNSVPPFKRKRGRPRKVLADASAIAMALEDSPGEMADSKENQREPLIPVEAQNNTDAKVMEATTTRMYQGNNALRGNETSTRVKRFDNAELNKTRPMCLPTTRRLRNSAVTSATTTSTTTEADTPRRLRNKRGQEADSEESPPSKKESE